MDMFPTTDKRVDMFPSTNDINVIVSTHVECVVGYILRVNKNRGNGASAQECGCSIFFVKKINHSIPFLYKL